ncbi:SDR family NAD(P)-dependent oxidoreductase [Promicromonospora sp. Populi]|uniref:SDR family NAD(P)-dependent oxidoreductase n=1 Tax=Promicromonospora sp. Populi TaxID=3239420 RepID=UPI0034E2BE89
MSLDGKVAVVTGSGRGLGLAYACELARRGASIVVNDVDKELADQAVATVLAAASEAGWDLGTETSEPAGAPRAVAVVAPVGPTATAQELVRTAVETFGRLDILVTNAGVLRDAVLWKMSDDDFDTVVDVHLRGTFTCVREAAIRFREQGDGGRIICIGSPTGQRGNFGQTSYAAVKAGIVGMVRTWAMELARAKVTVNAVVPVAATAMTDSVPLFKQLADAAAGGAETSGAEAQGAEDRGADLRSYARRTLGFGTPDDAAGIVAYLASDAAADVTGQAIGVGGDRLALWTHPTEAAVAFTDGGWSADALAEGFGAVFGGVLQTVGQELPAPPEHSAPQADSTPAADTAERQPARTPEHGAESRAS